MGANQSLPIRKKKIEKGRFGNCIFVTSAMQGWRPSMEDRFSNYLDVKNSIYFFGVYDGHAGSNTAQQLSENLHFMVKQQDNYKHGDIPGAAARGFIETDHQLNADQKLTEDISGSTAVLLILDNLNNHLYSASVGDSKAIISHHGIAQELTQDHLPTNPDEYLRIKRAGGFVNHDRVNGSLAMSRAFGDFIFKQNEDLSAEDQAVSCRPDVFHRPINYQNDEFMVLASDGVWEVLEPQAVIDFCRAKLAQKQNIQKVAMDLVDACITDDVMNEEGIGCDNITATIVVFTTSDGHTNGVESTAAMNYKKQSIKKKSNQKDKGGNDADNELVLDAALVEALAQKCSRPKLSPDMALPTITIYP